MKDDDWWTPNRLGYVALLIGTLALMFALDLDYWHGVALSFGIAMTALAVVLWWEAS